MHYIFIYNFYCILAPVNGNVSQKEDVTRTTGTIPTSLPPPPSRWGENRAKFSDVVARSQEIVPPFSNLNHKSQTNTSNLSTAYNVDVKDVQYAKSSVQELLQTSKEYNLPKPSPAPPLCITSLGKDKAHNPDPLILQPDSQHSNSYFINTFTEHPVSWIKIEFSPSLSLNTHSLILISSSNASWYRTTIFQKRTNL